MVVVNTHFKQKSERYMGVTSIVISKIIELSNGVYLKEISDRHTHYEQISYEEFALMEHIPPLEKLDT
jgi:hypothetical protein